LLTNPDRRLASSLRFRARSLLTTFRPQYPKEIEMASLFRQSGPAQTKQKSIFE
jgi:hypothetical protein